MKYEFDIAPAPGTTVPTYEAGDLLRFGDDSGEWFMVLPDEQQTDPNYARAISEDGRHGFFRRSMTHPHLRPVRVEGVGPKVVTMATPQCGPLGEWKPDAPIIIARAQVDPPKPVEPDPEGWGGTSGFRRPVYSVNSPKPFASEPQTDAEGFLRSIDGNTKTGTLTHPDLSPGESTLYERDGASTTLHANGSITMRHGRPLRISIAVTTERLARALFETDDDVIRLVTLRSENDVSTKRADVMQRCWDRGHAGESPEWKWYVRATDRAKAMGKAMAGKPSETPTT